MIKHLNIAQLYETLQTENSYYVMTKLCLGGNPWTGQRSKVTKCQRSKDILQEDSAFFGVSVPVQNRTQV